MPPVASRLRSAWAWLVVGVLIALESRRRLIPRRAAPGARSAPLMARIHGAQIAQSAKGGYGGLFGD